MLFKHQKSACGFLKGHVANRDKLHFQIKLNSLFTILLVLTTVLLYL